MMYFLRALARLDDHWAGDLIGMVCLFGISLELWFLGYMVGLK